MLKKDYVAIARIIARQIPTSGYIHKHTLVVELQVLFERDNARFDAKKWREACG